MTTQTTIAYYLNGNHYGTTGPTECANCCRSLIDRSADSKEDGVDPRNNAQVVVHTWEHDEDAAGKAVCSACHNDVEQAPLWLALAKWQARDTKNRRLELTNNSVFVIDGTRMRVLGAAGARLDADDVEAATKEAAVAPDVSESATVGFGVGDEHPADIIDECPKTERNVE